MYKLPIHWLPGESAYSVAARAYLASAYQSWKLTNLEIFGKVDVRLNVMLPGHLNALATLVGRSANELRTYGTGHPLVAFGMADKQAVIKMMQHELHGNASRVYEDSRLAASKLSFGHILKACPLCFMQDEAEHGIGYWHSIHQCHGIVVCPEHGLKLATIRAGEGGVNHQYVLPTSELLSETATGNEAEQKLSCYLMQLYQLLCLQTPIQPMPSLYKAWLDAKGYLTKASRIRWRYLRPALQEYWDGLFYQQFPALPLELSDFDFVPRLIHHATNVHYIKHTLLMGFLSHTPSLFFCGPKREVRTTVIVAQKTRPEISAVLSLFDKGLSMREVAKRLHCSIGYIKQLALREGREIERRRQFVTPIWNVLFGEKPF
ncbi:TniQ family protein [Vibrio parahaemolyticus]|uniref:TnsD family Tn7-like transposition protein n=1 Tax=Vibrio parahaemolyticus TaxID=670 RepID=UPI0032AEEA97|nr:TniQ family protein [Vibrio parahaemolyticus]